MAGTYRDLLWLGISESPYPHFAARSGERGYFAHVLYLVTEDVWQCSCPAKHGTCWHVKEAPKALFYVQQRQKFKAMADFPVFFDRWWPRYTPATSEEVYLGKPKSEWEIFFAALLDERNERDAYRRKYAGQVREILGPLEEVQ